MKECIIAFGLCMSLPVYAAQAVVRFGSFTPEEWQRLQASALQGGVRVVLPPQAQARMDEELARHVQAEELAARLLPAVIRAGIEDAFPASSASNGGHIMPPLCKLSCEENI